MNVSADPRKPQTPAPVIRKRKPRWGLWLFLLLIIGAAVYWYMRPKHDATAEGGAPGGAGGPGGGRGPGGPGGRGGFQRQMITVATEAVKQGDLPDYVSALGSVAALNTAIVRSRVDGQLVKVNFEEGQPVKEGDVIAEIDPRPFEIALQQAQGQLARDRAQLDNARLELQRYENAGESVTPQQLDAARSSVAQNEGVVKADESTVANATLQLGFCHVTAPFTGRAGLRQVDVGNLVHSSDANGIVVVTQIQPIAVRFSVPEDNLAQINRSVAADESLLVEVYDRSMKNKIASGNLSAIDNQIDATTGTVRMKAVVPNTDLALFPNQFVNIRLLVNTEKNVVLVPTSAIQINGPDRYVYVVGDDSTVQRRSIKIGNTEGLYSVATEGLKPGEVVATEGLDRLQDGTKVMTRANAPAMPTGNAGDRPRRGNRQKGDGSWGKKAQ